MQNRPAIGVAVIVMRQGRVLLGRRLNAHGQGTWAFPGGHLEAKESIEACARREVKEETGLDINTVTHAAFTNDIFTKEDKHYVTLFVTAQCPEGSPRVMEPHKCEIWDWFSWDDLPRPRFLSLENLRAQGFDPKNPTLLSGLPNGA